MKICFLVILLSLSYFEETYSTLTESPVELIDDLLVNIVGQNPLRDKAHVNVRSIGGEKEGTLNIDAHKNIFDDGKTRVVASVSGQGLWKSGSPMHKSAIVRLDAQKNLFKNENTIVYGRAFMERSVKTGVHRHNVFGAGVEFSKTLHENRNGAVLEAHGRYQRLWFSNHEHIADLGLKWIY